jgi:hypothetical protein
MSQLALESHPTTIGGMKNMAMPTRDGHAQMHLAPLTE